MPVPWPVDPPRPTATSYTPWGNQARPGRGSPQRARVLFLPVQRGSVVLVRPSFTDQHLARRRIQQLLNPLLYPRPSAAASRLTFPPALLRVWRGGHAPWSNDCAVQ